MTAELKEPKEGRLQDFAAAGRRQPFWAAQHALKQFLLLKAEHR